ncbi:MAG: Dabb family protein [Clostridia bacterium]|nr:Dabb family protein [Clostridia bacterium]
MVKHMIIWTLKEEIDKEAVKAEIKRDLEGLVGKIDGLLSMKILTEGFEGSAGDLMMDSAFESRAALDAYQAHPAHQAIAGGLVRPNVTSRASFDYEV